MPLLIRVIPNEWNATTINFQFSLQFNNFPPAKTRFSSLPFSLGEFLGDTTLCIGFHVSTCKPLRSNVCLFESVCYVVNPLQKYLSLLSPILNCLAINIYMVKDKFHLFTQFFHQAHKVLSPESFEYQQVRMNRDTIFTARH